MGEKDIIFKELFTKAGVFLMEKLLGAKIQKSEPITTELKKVEAKQPDFVAKVVINDKERILHIEFQSYNDPDMPKRMLRYRTELMIYNLPITQVLLYAGKEKLNMQDCIKQENDLSGISFFYKIIDITSLSPDFLIESSVPELVVLSVLCRVSEIEKQRVAKQMIEKLKNIVPKEKMSYYITIVSVLADVRGYKEIIKQEVEKMLEFDITKSWIYEEGLKKGKEEGIKVGKEEGIKVGREEGIKVGKEEGIKVGREEGIKVGKEEGIKVGKEEGIKVGREEGLKEGLKEGLYDTISSVLEVKFGRKSLKVAERIRKIEDLEKLKELKRDVIKAKSLRDFLKKLDSEK